MEAYRLGTARGVTFSFDDPVRYVTEFASTIPDASPSMRLDHLARRRSEIDVINGQVVELSRGLGLESPYNESLCAVIRARRVAIRRLGGAGGPLTKLGPGRWFRGRSPRRVGRPSVRRAIRGDRRARRRHQLIASAIELIGRCGYRELRLRALCQHAGLNDRYFHESFRDLEDLLIACYEEVAEVTARAVAAVEPPGSSTPTVQARKLMVTCFGAVMADRARGRLQLIEVVGVSPTRRVKASGGVPCLWTAPRRSPRRTRLGPPRPGSRSHGRGVRGGRARVAGRLDP